MLAAFMRTTNQIYGILRRSADLEDRADPAGRRRCRMVLLIVTVLMVVLTGSIARSARLWASAPGGVRVGRRGSAILW